MQRGEIKIPFYIIIAIFALTVVIFFYDQLAGASFFWDDFLAYVYPVQTFAARESAGFKLPFWNPYSHGGAPFLADLQVGFFYPLNRILNLFVAPDGSLPFQALQIVTIFHFIISQFSMYALMRKLKVSQLGSVIGAITYAFAFLSVLHVFHPMILIHLSWFPLVFSFFYTGLKNAEPRDSIFAGLLMGMSALAGHAQLTLFELLFLGLYLLWDFIGKLLNKSFKINDYRYIICAAATFIVCAGIFMVQYLPTKEFADLSVRNEMSYEKSAEGSLRYEQALTAFVPNLFGYSNSTETAKVPYYLKYKDGAGAELKTPYYFYWETGFYFGIVALGLGFFGLILNYKSNIVKFFIFASIFSILFALGDNSFLLRIFHKLPLFEYFRIPTRMLIFTVLAFSYFVGIGFDGLISKIRTRERTIKLLISLSIPIVVCAALLLPAIRRAVGVPDVYSLLCAEYALISLSISVLALVIAYLTYIKKLNYIVAGLALATLAFTDLYIAGAEFNRSPISDKQAFFLSGEIKDKLKFNPYANFFRIDAGNANATKFGLKKNSGMIDKIAFVQGYNPLLISRVWRASYANESIFSLFAVKYKLDSQHINGKIIEKPNITPQARLVYNYIIINPDSNENGIYNSNIDFSKTAILEESPILKLNPPDSTRPSSVKLVNYENDYLKYEVNSSANGLLCLSETWYPAWKAYINGKETAIHRTNGCFRLVEIPSGANLVEFKYESSSFRLGAGISLTTLILAVIGIVWFKPKKNLNSLKSTLRTR